MDYILFIVLFLNFRSRLCYLKRSVELGTGYWERKMDVKSLFLLFFKIHYSENLQQNSRKRLTINQTNGFLQRSFSECLTAGLDWNKLAEVRNIARHFYLHIHVFKRMLWKSVCVLYVHGISKGLRLNVTHINSVFTSCYLLSLKIITKQETFFSFTHILCLCILHFIYVTLKPVHFPQVPKSQRTCRNWMHAIVMVVTCIFLWISATVNYTRYTSVVRVSAQWCWL